MNNSQDCNLLSSHEVNYSICSFNNLANVIEFVLGNYAARQRKPSKLLRPFSQAIYDAMCIIFGSLRDKIVNSLKMSNSCISPNNLHRESPNFERNSVTSVTLPAV